MTKMKESPRNPKSRRPLQVLVRLLDIDGTPVRNVASAQVVDRSRDGRFSYQEDWIGLVVLTLDKTEDKDSEQHNSA